METKQKKITCAFNVGQEITKNDFNLLKNNYTNYDDTGETTFIIKKEIIEENLTFNQHVAGIRFMYGLKDALNPNSKVLFLIPCSSLSDTSIATEALLRKEGYNDHEGNVYSLQEIAVMMSYYIKNISKNNPNLNYKEITRSNFYGKYSLNNVLIPDCKFIEFHFGFKQDHIAPIIKPLDKNYSHINEIYMDFSEPCPPVCDMGGNEEMDRTCLTESAVKSSNELDLYRHYRDNHLLALEGGPELYEMYYFVSPLITKLIHKSATKEIVLQEFYEQEITPFKLLLKEGNYQEAAYALKQTLYKLAETYDYSEQFV